MNRMTVEKRNMRARRPSRRRGASAEREFFQRVVETLNQERIPYLVGGAFAVAWYTGIERSTKDFDIFVLQPDCQRVLDLFSKQGYETELTHPHWLGKIRFRKFTVDVIFSSGNGLATVDEHWFGGAVSGMVFDVPVRFAPVEEILYSKAFVMERERFDGADILHLILKQGKAIDWHHLLTRAGVHWRVILAHLIMFEFVYPSERGRVPEWAINFLIGLLRPEAMHPPTTQRVCYGTFLSREQYLIDITRWGFADGRATAPRTMTDTEIRLWTEAIEKRTTE